MTQSRNALSNLLARYKSIVNNCRLLNTFGSLTVATMLIAGGVASAEASIPTTTLEENSAYIVESTEDGKIYFKNFTMKIWDGSSATETKYGINLVDTDGNEYTGIADFIPREGNGWKIEASDEGSLTFTADGQTFSVIITGSSDYYGKTNTNDDGTTGDDGGALTHETKDLTLTISGDFVGNTATGMGGAIYSEQAIDTITGDFIANSATGSGGAIYTSGTNSSITGIYGDFIGNSTDASGGAIYQYSSSATIGTIEGDFIGNSAQSGGAIYNKGTITTLTGDFIENSIGTDSVGISGAAIYNDGTINSITGDFIANSATNGSSYVSGGAIYNSDTIGTIEGDFLYNSISASSLNTPTRGGAIYNTSGATITSLTGNFIGNTATNAANTTNTSGSQGGAIYNYNASVGDIEGDFIENSAWTTGDDLYAHGGAIYNVYASNLSGYSSSTIGNITGDFIGNSVGGTAAYSYGGAIYNSGSKASIGDITGDFINNYVATTGANAAGGAIYNSTTIGTITGSFIGNYASGSSSANGGAIYTAANLTFANDDGTITFSDNYTTTDDGVTMDYNAIYASSAALKFEMTGSGDIVMNDSILGNSYTVNIAGLDASDNTFYLNDEIDSNGVVTVSNATLELGTYTHTNETTTIGSVDFSTLDLSGNSTLAINVGTETITLTSNLTIDSGEGLIVKSGTLDVSDYTLTVASDASTFATKDGATLTVDAADFGVSTDGTSLTFNASAATVAMTLTNGGTLVLEGLSLMELDYDDYTTFLSSFTLADGGVVYLYGVIIEGTPFYLSALADGTALDTTVIGDSLASGVSVSVSGLTGTATTINNGTLTLTGEANGIVSEASITNKSTLYLGIEDGDQVALQGNLETTSGASTTAFSALKITGDLTSAGDMTFEDALSVDGTTTLNSGTASFNGTSSFTGSFSNNGADVVFHDKAIFSDTFNNTSKASYTAFNGVTTFADIENAGYISINDTASFTAYSGTGMLTIGNEGNSAIVSIADNASMTIESGASLIISNGTLDVSSGTLYIASDASTFETGSSGVLIVNASDFGIMVDGESLSTSGNATVELALSNGGTLVLEGLSINSLSYSDYTSFLTSFTDSATGLVSGGTISLSGVTIDTSDIILDDIIDGTDISEQTVNVEGDGSELKEGVTASVGGLTGEGKTTNKGNLTITGKGTEDGILAEGDIINEGTLILGSEDTESEMQGKLTNSGDTTTKGEVSLAEVENSGTFSAEGETYVESFSNNGELNVTGNITIDNYTAYANAETYVGDTENTGTFIAQNVDLNGSVFVSSSGWTNDASSSSLAFTDDAVSGLVTVAQNSYAVLGDGTEEELSTAEEAFAEYGLTWGESDISAALYINKAYTVASNGGLYVDGTKTDSTATADSVYFASGSLLAVDADNIASGTAALTASTITVDSGASLLVISSELTYDDSGEATVTIAQATSSLTIADGAWGYNEDGTLDTSTIYVNSALLELGSVELEDNTYTVIFSKLASEDVYGDDVDDEIGDQLDDYTTGNTFLDNALAMASTKKGAKSIESSAKVAIASGVGASLGHIGSASAANIEARVGSATAFNDKDTSKMLAMSGDGVVLPMDKAQEGLGIWVMPMYKHVRASGFESGSYDYGYDTDLYGASLGADYTFASSLRLGLAFNVGSGQTDSTGDFDNTENDFDYFGLTAYGSMNFGKLAILADIGYTASSNDIDQSNEAGHLTADADADLFSIGLKGQYAIGLDGFNVTPYAGVRVNYYDIDSFNTKYQGTTTVHTHSSDYTIVEFPLGLTFDTTVVADGWDITPSLGLGVKFAAGDLDLDQKVSYTGVDGSAVLSSDVADAVTFQGALGLGMSKDAYSLSLGYTLDWSENVQSHGVNLNLRYEF